MKICNMWSIPFTSYPVKDPLTGREGKDKERERYKRQGREGKGRM